MFVPEINFLRDQAGAPGGAPAGYTPAPEFSEAGGGVDPLLVGTAVPIVALVAVAGLTLLFNSQVSAKEGEVASLDGRLGRLNAQVAEMGRLKQEIDSERQRVEAVVNLFDLSRPWSAVLEDLRRRVPEGVWLNSLTSSSGKDGDLVNLEGRALRFEEVAAFQLTLKDSPFVADATIQDATKEEGKDNTPATVAYKMQVRLSQRKLRELVGALEATGSVGILEKLRRVQQEKLVR
jgi:Tfp pilus assembly protein PilN